MNRARHPYEGKTLFLPTKHGKGALITPSFKSILGVDLQEFDVDTDQLGSFSGEVPRVGTAVETARKKALLAGTPDKNRLLIASEGSIGVDPLIPFFNSDIETLLFIDEKLEIEIIETLRSTEIVAFSQRFKTGDDIEKFLLKAQFPHHKMIVKSTNPNNSLTFKGIDDYETLLKAISACSSESEGNDCVVESDLRAHCSPSRQKIIRNLAYKLAKRIKNLCPLCQTPGWGLVSYIKGVPCATCTQVSIKTIKAEVFGCAGCTFSEEGKTLRTFVDPAQCDWCNP